jgi:hypothetical protein
MTVIGTEIMGFALIFLLAALMGMLIDASEGSFEPPFACVVRWKKQFPSSDGLVTPVYSPASVNHG